MRLTQLARSAPARSADRLIGVDLARGLAVLGMFAAHVGPDPGDGGVVGFAMEVAHGRSSALFAFLAGFSLVLITGRPDPKTGLEGRRAKARIVVRALVLLPLGWALTALDTPIDVILAFYGAYFLLALPLVNFGPRALALLAALFTAVGPIAYLIAQSILYGMSPTYGPSPLDGISPPDGTSPLDGPPPLAAIRFILELLVTGTYPAITCMPYVLTGMAVARLDLLSPAMRGQLATAGTALAALGYGGSWLALNLVRGLPFNSWAWWSDAGGVPEHVSLGWLFAAFPHSNMPLSIVANTGVAILVVAGSVQLCERFAVARRVAGPVIAVGAMSLTAYVGHVAGIWAFGMGNLTERPSLVLAGFVAVALVFAVVWKRLLGRGPLEFLLNRATRVARYIR